MARRTQTLVIEDKNRDHGKAFLLTEASSITGEDWGARTFLIMARAGIDIPEDVAQAGVAGVAAMLQGVDLRSFGNLDWGLVKPLLNEMMETCVRRIPDPRHPEITRRTNDDDFEEVGTLVAIRQAVIGLHLSFSAAASP